MAQITNEQLNKINEINKELIDVSVGIKEKYKISTEESIYFFQKNLEIAKRENITGFNKETMRDGFLLLTNEIIKLKEKLENK